MVSAQRGASACLRATTATRCRHAPLYLKHWSNIISNCSRRRGPEQGHTPFTKAGTLAAHYGGVETVEPQTVLLAVDRASTE